MKVYTPGYHFMMLERENEENRKQKQETPKAKHIYRSILTVFMKLDNADDLAVFAAS
jgi:hypothetical protein